MSSSRELEAWGYLEALKDLLKERGVTYVELAKAVECSLPTVKRALNKTSLPFNRLLEFCDAAQIPFRDVHQLAERRRPKHFVFNDEQDRIFSEREELLGYLLELARGASPADIADRHDLDARSTDLYLTQLARIGLIERPGGNRVKLIAKPPFGFGPESRVLRREQGEFMKRIVTDVIGRRRRKDRFAVLKSLRLTREDYHEMVADMEKVIDRFAAIAEHGLRRGDVSSWQVAFASGPGAEPSLRRLPRLEG